MSKRSRREFLKEMLVLAGVGASVAVFRWWKSRTSLPAGESSTLQVWTADSGLEMVYVEDGIFQMGCAGCQRDERPMHTVILNWSYYIAKYAVTFDQYDAYCEETGKPLLDDGGWGRGDMPISGLNWYDAVGYCNWLSEKEGLTPCYREGSHRTIWDREANGYRLPTEAEWEYAARGGALSAGYECPGSDDPDEVAWYADNSDGRPHPVGQKSPNELGLYDMGGNIWEFCWDRYAWNYYIYCGDPVIDPRGFAPLDHPNVVLRGGNFTSSPYELRVTARGYDVPGDRGMYGLRLARTGEKTEEDAYGGV